MIEDSRFLSSAERFLKTESSFELLTWLGMVSIALLLVSGALRILNVYVIARFTAGQKRELGRNLLRRYLFRPYVFHLNRNSSDLASNLLSEVDEAFRVAYRPAAQLVNSLLTLLAVIAVLVIVNVWVTMAALVLIGGIYAGIYGVVRMHIRRLGGVRATAIKHLYQSANEALQGIKEIKVLGREEHYLSRYDRASKDERSATMKLRVLVDVPHHFIQTSVLVAVIVFCLVFVTEDMLANADAASGLVPLIGVFAAAGQRLIPELHAIYGALITMRYGAAAIDRLYADFADDPPKTPALTQSPLRLQNTLCLADVNYSYPESNGIALKKISVEILAGERIGIAGQSGAGKSTLTDIILGLLTPSSGRLTVDGTDIGAGTVSAWQRSLGFVPQEIFLADTTVIDNIALGLARDDIDDERVRRCVNISQASEFIADLPQGLDTVIGERGVRLSGGQRQRIAISRAIYKGVDLLVFDEATSALDAFTEQEVMSAIEGLPGEITVILVAHRMTTLDICDRIIVMDKGSIAGVGTRAELTAACAAYRRLIGHSQVSKG
jgi:ABC-type multidrug transport system fused ATPase/permease subunit